MNSCICFCECGNRKQLDSDICRQCSIGNHKAKYTKKEKPEPAKVINTSELKQLIMDVYKTSPDFIADIINEIQYEKEREINGLSKIVFNEITEEQVTMVTKAFGKLKYTMEFYNRSNERIIGMPYNYVNDIVTIEIKSRFIQTEDLISVLVNLDSLHYDIDMANIVQDIEHGREYVIIARKRSEK